jgi:hypothetical protein
MRDKMKTSSEDPPNAPWSRAFSYSLPSTVICAILTAALAFNLLVFVNRLNSAMAPQPAKKIAMIPQHANSAMPAQQQDGPFRDRSKRHVSAMLKFLPEPEQQTKADEVAMGFKKLFADEEKWGPIMARMKKIAEEDHLKVVKKRPERLVGIEEVDAEYEKGAKDKTEDVQSPPADAPKLRSAKSMLVSTEQEPHASSAVPASTTVETETPPDGDAQRRSRRCRPVQIMSTDEISVATKTVIRSSTAGAEKSPTGAPPLRSAKSMSTLARDRALSTPRENWAVIPRGPATPLSPIPTGNAFAGGGFWEALTPKTPKTPAPVTPITAIPRSPFSPVVPSDPEARDAYNKVKKEVEALARTICASRMSAHTTINNSNDIPNNLLKPKDVLKAAELTVHHRRIKLKTAIDAGLPGKLRTLAAEEAQIIRQLSIKDIPDLIDIDSWLQVDEKTLELSTILDAQRERMHMHQTRRKSKDLKVSNAAVELAWATRILEDAEHIVANDDGDSIISDEDKGYDYTNFMRSIKSEASSSSDIASMMSGGRSYTDLSLRSSGGTNMESFPSLSSETTWMSQSQRSSTSPRKPYGMTMRSRENSYGQNTSPERPQRSSTSPRKTIGLLLRESYDSTPCPDKHTSAASMSRTTTLIKEEDEKEDLPSPQLSPEEKSFRRMGASHTELNNWATQLKELEERQKNKTVLHARQPALQDHPALRSDSRDRPGTVDSTDSWKCADAALHERAHSASSTRNDVSPSRRPPAAIPLPPSRPVSSFMPANLGPPPPRLPPPPPGYKYAPFPNGNASMQNRAGSLHISVRHKQHVRSKSSLARADELEKEWRKELRMMESRERGRQEEEMEERRRGRSKGQEKGG